MIFKNKYAHWALLFCCFLAPSIQAAQSEEECQLQQARDKIVNKLCQLVGEDEQFLSMEDLRSLVSEHTHLLSPGRTNHSHFIDYLFILALVLNTAPEDEGLELLPTFVLIELYNGTVEDTVSKTAIFSLLSSDYTTEQGTLAEKLDSNIQFINYTNMQRRIFSLAPIAETPPYPTVNRLDPERIYMYTVMDILPILSRLGIRSENIRDIFSNESIRDNVDRVTSNHIQNCLITDHAWKDFKEHAFYNFIFHMNDVNSPVDEDGRTLLMFCAMMGNLERVTFLCANGARASIKDATGKSSLDYAEEFGHHQITKFLEQQDIQAKVDALRNSFDAIDSISQLPGDILTLIHHMLPDQEMTRLSYRFENPVRAKLHYLKVAEDGIRKMIFGNLLLSRGVQVPEA